MSKSTRRTALFIGMFVLSVALVSQNAAARKAKVTLTDGRVLTGEVIDENAQSITLEISGIKTRIERDRIKAGGVEFLKTVEEEYPERRGKLADDDISGRYELARWLYNEKAYRFAKVELDDLATRAPDNQRVKILRAVVMEKLKDEPAPPNGTNIPPNTTDVPSNGTGTSKADGPLPTQTLTEKQINKIRVIEIDLSAKPRIVVPRDVLEKFVKEYENEELMPKGRALSSFKSATKGVEQLTLMFQLKAREYYDEVIVRDDPPVMRDFRILHRNYLLSHCATGGCHGGPQAGNLFLFTKGPNTEETIYTNFYILDTFSNKIGYMIDRDYPKESLLLTYGLPRDQTTKPHPDVPGFRPAFTAGTRDRLYLQVLEWIPKLLRPKVNYELRYTPPRLAAPAKPESPESPEEPTPGKTGS